MIDSQDFVYALTWSAKSPDLAPKSKTSDSSTLIFAAKKSGLYRSSDNGRTWSDAYAALKLKQPLPTQAVAVTVANDITYAFAAVHGKVLRSLDGGKKWEVAELDSPAPIVTALAVSPNFVNDGLVLAATVQDGIFFSTDRGVKWQGWNFGLYDSNINALAFIDSQNVIAAAQSGVFTSTNAGRSWRDLDFPIEAAPALCAAVSVDNAFYIGTENGLYRSVDVGQAWEQIQAGAVEHIQINGEKKIIIVRDGELLSSKDGGKTWRTRAGLKTDSVITCICVPLGLDPSNPLLIGLDNGEVITL
ncbi:MAG: hypothetical protein WA997_18775 [Anaerolineales bacterium]|jgi:photosystem II stability/assembly factor-like uncharacterized protein